MPRIIMKSPYIKPNSKTNIGNYVSYIATREGVEKAENSKKHLASTSVQEKIIDRLLKDFPDSKDLYEYEDYINNPTRVNADELILRIAETHAELFGDREKYVSYIAQRPRVEKLSSHGLFTDDCVPIILSDVQKEVAESKSNIWTHIISLKREDAERLGYNNANAWMNLIRSQRNMIADNMKIAPENFKWYAAFHNEGHHPHIHMIAYSTKPNEAYLTEKGIENIKSNLANVIFRQDLISVYQKQTEHRDTLRAEARDIVADIVVKVNSETYVSDLIQQKFLLLAEKLSKTDGKKVYGYLKADIKTLVDSIVDELASDDRIKKLYDLWYEQKENTIRTYTDEMPERIPLVDNKEFKSIKNAVIKEALKLNLSEDNAEEPEYINEENTSAESTNVSNKGVIYPKYSIKTKRNSVVISSLHLLRSLCNMLQNRLRFEEKQKSQQTDKKLQQKINDKKQAQGLKM
ncbi:MAG: MobP3 family relaxase [Acutalibacteraceae bacterium]|nr:MobP3 family relaxase [Acutalibacteraceae bacterium]